MSKKILLAVVVIIVLIIAVVFVQALLRNNFSLFAKTATLTVNEKKYTLDVADTPEKSAKGLSGRESLPENKGMLFVFEEPGIYPFWMKDMQFPIDIIFLRDNKVVTVYDSVPAPTSDTQNLTVYPPDEKSDKVIELNAGEAKKNNIKKDTTVDLSL